MGQGGGGAYGEGLGLTIASRCKGRQDIHVEHLVGNIATMTETHSRNERRKKKTFERDMIAIKGYPGAVKEYERQEK